MPVLLKDVLKIVLALFNFGIVQKGIQPLLQFVSKIVSMETAHFDAFKINKLLNLKLAQVNRQEQ